MSPVFTTRLRWLLWLAVVSLFVGVWLYPVSSGFTRGRASAPAQHRSEQRRRDGVMGNG